MTSKRKPKKTQSPALSELQQISRDIRRSKRAKPITKKRIRDRIAHLETENATVINQPAASMSYALFTAFEQIRLVSQLGELHLLLEENLPPYPMLKSAGEP